MKRYFIIILLFINLLFYSEEDILYFSKEMLKEYKTVLLIINPEDGTIIEASKGAIDFYGYNQLIGMKISEINTLPEVKIKNEMEKAQIEKRNYFRFKHKLANNKLKNVEVNFYPIKYKDKNVLLSRIRDIDNEIKIQIFIYFLNILIFLTVIIFLIVLLFLLSNLKKNKLKLEKEINLLNKIQEITNTGGWEFDLIKKKLIWSDQVYKIHELQKEEYIPQVETAINFYDENSNSREIIKTHFEKLMQEGVKYDLELIIITAKNNLRYIKTDGEALRNKNGKIIKLYGTIKDITEIKNNENYLIKAQELTEKANLIKMEFLYKINHEMRSPLNGILGFIELLIEKETNNKKRMYLDIIYNLSYKLRDIINNLLTLSNIKIHAYEKKVLETNLFVFVKELSEIYEKKCKSKGIDFKLEIDDSLNKNILIDRYIIFQILNNLLSNSFKYTDKGEIYLSLEKDNDNIKIYIKDSGKGFSKEMHNKIMNSFKNNEFFLNRENINGIGCGLIIIKDMVNILNGKIEIKSEESKGTEVIIEIPFSEVKDKNNFIDFKEDSESMNDKKLSIISAEDSEINQKLLELMLKSENIIFKKVYNGKELLEEIEKNRYDIILMDIQMPELNGIEATKIIRKIKDYENIPIIGISAFDFEEERERIFKAGIDDFIGKPINKKELIKKIKKWYETKR